MEDTSFNRGSFGQIYHGTYMNAPVVVKCVDISSETTQRDFMREVSVWQKANRHPNIVPLYGACDVGEPCFMVCKHIAGGSLSVYLRRQKGDRQSKAWRVLLDVTHGLQFLHSRGIIHGDLKGSNVLVDGDTAMLTDFGMSCVGTGSKPQFDNLGAIRWRAPEFVAKGKSSFEADVYSLGMVVVVAVVGILPWGMAPEASVQWHLEHGKFMKKPEVMSDEMWGLVCAVCNFDPSKRLKLEDVEKQIKKFAGEEEDAFRLRGSAPLPTSKSSPVAAPTA
ncbi:hypothetical protein PHYSODRAFT_525874 [Phytophthora sojae]|uniref:Protein kinase domain-containing protein n=1 Tax=Phytophthora sojae (strain P6497) TaxID=1094619 RepID=G5A5D3_PHYSP|nr:hypothetical protein PHYSODRAFT_525874 [Phytophthora sojae]EGZ09317.1 hypothetical protein PHYSODRAFT_525874 [Phytophthora sojae]|eukprot:XP_009535950.1 hypothetical protein PHYSODRAFT_525874 [Phytophthora sojae]